jgi:hypothetical protein
MAMHITQCVADGFFTDPWNRSEQVPQASHASEVTEIHSSEPQHTSQVTQITPQNLRMRQRSLIYTPQNLGIPQRSLK